MTWNCARRETRTEELFSSGVVVWSLSPSILTRTTPLLSTISWMIWPFFPITFPRHSPRLRRTTVPRWLRDLTNQISWYRHRVFRVLKHASCVFDRLFRLEWVDLRRVGEQEARRDLRLRTLWSCTSDLRLRSPWHRVFRVLCICSSRECRWPSPSIQVWPRISPWTSMTECSSSAEKETGHDPSQRWRSASILLRVVWRLFPFLEGASLWNVEFENAYPIEFERDEEWHRYLTRKTPAQSIDWPPWSRRRSYDNNKTFFVFVIVDNSSARCSFEIFVVVGIATSANAKFPRLSLSWEMCDRTYASWISLATGSSIRLNIE